MVIFGHADLNLALSWHLYVACAIVLDAPVRVMNQRLRVWNLFFLFVCDLKITNPDRKLGPKNTMLRVCSTDEHGFRQMAFAHLGVPGSRESACLFSEKS